MRELTDELGIVSRSSLNGRGMLIVDIEMLRTEQGQRLCDLWGQ